MVTAMNEIALITANFGGIDAVKPLPPHDGIDAFYYTDEQTCCDAPETVAATWTRILIPNYPRHDFGPRLRSRYFKHQIHRLTEGSRHRWLVWSDSSLQFHDLSFLRPWAKRLADLPPTHRLMLVPHPGRNTVGEEYSFIQSQIQANDEYHRIRYAQEKMTEQIEYFESRGWNLGARLWCGTFWMIERNDLLCRCWDDWWDQNLRYGMMDQLSLPVLLEHHGCVPQALEARFWTSNCFSYVQHQRSM